jgi:predicted RNA-binding Zn-ribbon protein involved in translation (DUF1610 family)
MTWFEDLTPYAYLVRAGRVPERTLNVGWLDEGHEFPTGDVPASFVDRLRTLAECATTMQTRGLHECPFCSEEPDTRAEWWLPRASSGRHGSNEIRGVGADGVRYAAPTLVVHYVTAHRYRPPQAFIDAVVRISDLRPEDALLHNLCLTCGSHLTRDPERSYETFADFACDVCGVSYTRWFASKS